MEDRESAKRHFQTLGILTVYGLYILDTVVAVRKAGDRLPVLGSSHGYLTRNRNQANLLKKSALQKNGSGKQCNYSVWCAFQSDTSSHVCVRLAQVKPQDLPGTSESSMSSTGPKPRSILTLNPSSSTCKGLPPPPKTSVQFHISWNGIKSDNKLCYQFLKQIPGEELPEIFKESLESRTFTSIVQILALEFTAAGDGVLPYLQGLAKVRRFSTLVLFMSPADKTNLTTLFDYCTQKTEASPDEIAKLRKLYELL
ncbi:RNA polymerase II-associated protein 3 [Homalodisca vitripennis]|nr:RNA polymerase II-associated protein 3 [Homalodisca vitripennis]